jgi:hypothetical protein
LNITSKNIKQLEGFPKQRRIYLNKVVLPLTPPLEGDAFRVPEKEVVPLLWEPQERWKMTRGGVDSFIML